MKIVITLVILGPGMKEVKSDNESAHTPSLHARASIKSAELLAISVDPAVTPMVFVTTVRAEFVFSVIFTILSDESFIFLIV